MKHLHLPCWCHVIYDVMISHKAPLKTTFGKVSPISRTSEVAAEMRPRYFEQASNCSNNIKKEKPGVEEPSEHPGKTICFSRVSITNSCHGRSEEFCLGFFFFGSKHFTGKQFPVLVPFIRYASGVSRPLRVTEMRISFLPALLCFMKFTTRSIYFLRQWFDLKKVLDGARERSDESASPFVFTQPSK